MSDDLKKDDDIRLHRGPEHSSPYPVSRQAPSMDLVDVAKQIKDADQMVNARAGAKLKVIADQIRALQKEAHAVLDETRRDQQLHTARCHFKRQPGKIYHLYQHPNGETYFSMLSPEDWQDNPPHTYIDSYRLEADMSWTPLAEFDHQDDSNELVQRLLQSATE